MKQTIKFICLLIMISFFFVVVNVKATNKGESETFTVNVAGKSDIQSGAISLSYDDSALELTNASWIITGTLIQDFNKTTNDGVFAYTTGQNIGGNIFTMTFKVKDNAQIKKYEIIAAIKLVDTKNQSTTQTKTFTIDVECTHDFSEEVVDTKYLKSEATCSAPKTYYKSCKYCGKAGTTTFTDGNTLPHKFDKKIENSIYLAKSGTCTEKAEYYYACSVCEGKGTTTYMSSQTPSHSFSNKWYTDANNHWHECDNCVEKKDLATHTPGAQATETTPQVCTTCGYVIKAALGHEHNFDVTEYKIDANNHWYECECGEKAEVKAHTYDNDCDADCNGCSYERTVTHTFGSWVSDDSNHWKECSCGEKAEIAAHAPGKEATETTPQICTVCNHVLKEATNHTHDYGSEYKSDSENHWHECVCGDKKDVTTHKFDGGVIIEEATEDAEGVIKYTCTCGYEKLDFIPKLAKKKGCQKDLATLVVGLISLSMVGVLLKRREN